MKCPKCGGAATVQRTEKQSDGSIMRRRLCTSCGHKFLTKEDVATKQPRTPFELTWR